MEFGLCAAKAEISTPVLTADDAFEQLMVVYERYRGCRDGTCAEVANVLVTPKLKEAVLKKFPSAIVSDSIVDTRFPSNGSRILQLNVETYSNCPLQMRAAFYADEPEKKGFVYGLGFVFVRPYPTHHELDIKDILSTRACDRCFDGKDYKLNVVKGVN